MFFSLYFIQIQAHQSTYSMPLKHFRKPTRWNNNIVVTIIQML